MIELKNFIKELVRLLTSFLCILKVFIFTFGVNENICNFLGNLVVIIHKAKGLQSRTCHYFNICILALEVVESFRDLNWKSPFIVFLSQHISNLKSHFCRCNNLFTRLIAENKQIVLSFNVCTVVIHLTRYYFTVPVWGWETVVNF